MPLAALDIPPGFYRKGTDYQSRGRWFDGSLVRWRGDLIEPIGGWPGTALHGLDISREMLKSADARLGRAAKLAEADATSFDPQALFGCQRFDRIVLSYCLSMIPGWQAALDHAAGMLGPDGSLHIVDFGSLKGMPWPLRPGLQRWLARFHVSPRLDLDEIATAIARRHGLECHVLRGPLDYFRLVTLVRPE